MKTNRQLELHGQALAATLRAIDRLMVEAAAGRCPVDVGGMADVVARLIRRVDEHIKVFEEPTP